MKKTCIQKINNKYVVALVMVMVMPLFAFSQLSVTTNNNATILAQNIAGTGVTVSSATINCNAQGAGTFTETVLPNLGIGNGIVLTTGYATGAGGPAIFSNTTTGNNFSDPNLVAISPTANKDVCMLTFTFTPICNIVSMTYVFGSEEYPKYINSFNDAFGMFITGPIPCGGNYSALNIATLPDGYNTPVEIDSVNGGYTTAEGATTPIAASHPTYYVNNFNYVSGNYQTVGANGDISYHGYTIPITSTVSVVPGSTYVLKIGVADATNGNFDSGVFIQGNSISCAAVPPVITVSSTPSNCGSNNGTASVSVTNYTGTPTYSWTPGGQTTSSINNLSAGSYTCLVSLPLGGCAGTYTQNVVATVTSASSPTVAISGNQTICSGNSTTLTGATASNYTWLPGNQTTSSITVSPTTNTTYTLIGSNGTCTATAVATVTVNATPTITITPNPYAIYVGASSTLTASGTATTYTWNAGSTTNPLVVNPGTTTNYTITGTSAAGCTNTATSQVIVNATPTIIIPNIFSPNGDGINDIFFITATGISNFDCQVYDRWGLLLHEWTGLNDGWDGKGKNGNPSPDGTYFYIINYNDNQNKPVNKHGFFELIR